MFQMKNHNLAGEVLVCPIDPVDVFQEEYQRLVLSVRPNDPVETKLLWVNNRPVRIIWIRIRKLLQNRDGEWWTTRWMIIKKSKLGMIPRIGRETSITSIWIAMILLSPISRSSLMSYSFQKASLTIVKRNARRLNVLKDVKKRMENS